MASSGCGGRESLGLWTSLGFCLWSGARALSGVQPVPSPVPPTPHSPAPEGSAFPRDILWQSCFPGLVIHSFLPYFSPDFYSVKKGGGAHFPNLTLSVRGGHGTPFWAMRQKGASTRRFLKKTFLPW